MGARTPKCSMSVWHMAFWCKWSKTHLKAGGSSKAMLCKSFGFPDYTWEVSQLFWIYFWLIEIPFKFPFVSNVSAISAQQYTWVCNLQPSYQHPFFTAPFKAHSSFCWTSFSFINSASSNVPLHCAFWPRKYLRGGSSQKPPHTQIIGETPSGTLTWWQKYQFDRTLLSMKQPFLWCLAQVGR